MTKLDSAGAVSPHIVIIGAGGVGGYVGGHLSGAGYDVTLVDFWSEHVQAVRSNGIELTGMVEGEGDVFHPQILNMHEIGCLRRGKPIDIAIIAMKSYDTAWATTMIKPYLAPSGFVVSLQNCLNEEIIADIVGWGKTLGCIASQISVELFAPGKIRRNVEKGTAGHTVFRIGEIHGRETARVVELAKMLSYVDSTKITSNLWGERWSKLSHNAMRNGLSAATGLSSGEIDEQEHIRLFTILLGAEAIAVGRALGYDLEKVGKLTPDIILNGATGDPAALQIINETFVSKSGVSNKSKLRRPSMAQDMAKGRRTEIEEINGYIVAKGKTVGIPTPHNERLTKLVQDIERGELKADISNIPRDLCKHLLSQRD